MNVFPSSCFARYPIRYVNQHIQKMFLENSIRPASILSPILDEDEYLLCRRRLLATTTKSEHARASRIASQMDPTQIGLTNDPLVKMKLMKKKEKRNSIILHHNYERRFAHYKSEMHRIWNATFPIASGIDTKLIVGTRNNPNLTQELVRRSPPYHTRRAEDKKTTVPHINPQQNDNI